MSESVKYSINDDLQSWMQEGDAERTEAHICLLKILEAFCRSDVSLIELTHISSMLEKVKGKGNVDGVFK